MAKLMEKVQIKAGTVVLAIIAIGLITAITSIFIGNSNIKKVDINSSARSVASVDIEKSIKSEQTPEVEMKPIMIIPEALEQRGTSQGTGQTQVSEQTEVIVNSIQEGQPKTIIKSTPPPKPVLPKKVTVKTVKPTYKEQDVKPKQSHPKMGDKNNKGQIYIEGFGWIKDEGGGGKGTTVGKPGDQLTGNKVGTMN